MTIIRGKKVEIRNSYIAGSSRSAVGAAFAVHLGACDSAIIENNRFGYESGHEGFNDASQGGAIPFVLGQRRQCHLPR